jgi:hypothetical protein
MELKDETNKTNQGTPPEKGQPPEGQEGSTSITARTYTEEEYKKAVSDALAKAGRDAKSLELRETKLKDIETREQALKAREEESRNNADIDTITENYQDGDPDKLKALSKKLNLMTKEQIEAAAEIIFSKKTGDIGQKTEGFKADSGMTKGGAVDYSRMKPEEKFRLGLEAEAKKRR